MKRLAAIYILSALAWLAIAALSREWVYLCMTGFCLIMAGVAVGKKGGGK